MCRRWCYSSLSLKGTAVEGARRGRHLENAILNAEQQLPFPSFLPQFLIPQVFIFSLRPPIVSHVNTSHCTFNWPHDTFGQRIWTCIHFRHLNLRKHKIGISHTCIVIYSFTLVYAHLYYMYACMYICMGLFWLRLKHGSFNKVDYWELSVDSVFIEKKT